MCPGVFETPMLSGMKDAKPEVMGEIIRAQSIGRLGDSDEMAAAVLWLCSPASSFVIGTVLAVDGGFTVQ